MPVVVALADEGFVVVFGMKLAELEEKGGLTAISAAPLPVIRLVPEAPLGIFATVCCGFDASILILLKELLGRVSVTAGAVPEEALASAPAEVEAEEATAESPTPAPATLVAAPAPATLVAAALVAAAAAGGGGGGGGGPLEVAQDG
jgi:hypothetical protein